MDVEKSLKLSSNKDVVVKVATDSKINLFVSGVTDSSHGIACCQKACEKKLKQEVAKWR